MDPSAGGSGASRRRAEQFVGVAEKLLLARDWEGCKEFSSQALAAYPNTPGAEDLNAAASVLLAAERRLLPNGIPDPYAVLGLDSTIPASRHPDAVRAHYSRLSFLLSRSRPDPSFSLAFTNAAGHVAEAWRFLSDPVRKSSLDSGLDAAAAAAAAAANAARAYHSPTPNRPQSQPPLHARPNPPFATPSPRPTPSPAAPSPWPTPSPAAPSPWPTPSPAAPTPRATPPPVTPPPRPTPPQATPYPRPTPPRAAVAPWQTPPSASPAPRPVASPPRPQPPPAASPPRPTPAPVVSPPRPTPPPAGTQARPTPLAPAPQTPAEARVTSVASGTLPSSTFWTVCTACRHIHQYDRLYEKRKLLCPSCRQTFLAEAMAEPPPIVPGTDMYYCTWGFFPVGFPGCPGFDRLVNSQPQGPDQLNASWLMGTAGVKGNAGDTGVKGNAAGNVENGVPVGAAAEIPVEEVPATTPPAKPMRVKVAAKKRGRPKGSKNKTKM